MHAETVAHQAPCLCDFPGKNTGVGCHFLLWGNILNTPMLLVKLTVKEANIMSMWIILEIIFYNNKDSTGRLKSMN